MKILYAIQGTGNGHIARATEIVPYLKQIAETDVLISGTQGDLNLPFPIQYKLKGFSFVFGKKGGIDFVKTAIQFSPFQLLKDTLSLPVKKYDLVLSDFEPVSAWACKMRGVKCVGVSHQNAVLHPDAPKPGRTDLPGKFILNYYAPTRKKYGYHFKELDENHFTPVIRRAIYQSKPENRGHYTVYLPAFSDKKIEIALSAFPDIRWEVFSKHCKKSYSVNNISFSPVSLEEFNQSFIHCEGILCAAGFETPAEALFMGKKLCVIPMRNQYEQVCNGKMLDSLGITVLPDLINSLKHIQQWLASKEKIQISYPDRISEILNKIVMQEVKV